MTNEEKYLNAFIETFAVSAEAAKKLGYQEIEEWDSVGHMGLIATIEDVFNIMLDTDDIIDLSSYDKGKEILSAKYDVQF